MPRLTLKCPEGQPLEASGADEAPTSLPRPALEAEAAPS